MIISIQLVSLNLLKSIKCKIYVNLIILIKNEAYSLVFICLMGYRTKRVGFIGDGASKLLLPSPF